MTRRHCRNDPDGFVDSGRVEEKRADDLVSTEGNLNLFSNSVLSCGACATCKLQPLDGPIEEFRRSMV